VLAPTARSQSAYKPSLLNHASPIGMCSHRTHAPSGRLRPSEIFTPRGLGGNQRAQFQVGLMDFRADFRPDAIYRPSPCGLDGLSLVGCRRGREIFAPRGSQQSKSITRAAIRSAVSLLLFFVFLG